MNISYKLLENGLDFVLSSALQLEQLTREKKESERKGLLKYSLLHLFSGIELIMKYRLSVEHWTYVYADMNKANKEKFLKGDFQSVHCNDLFLRLSALCSVEITEKKKNEVNKLRELRNKVMHFEVSENINAIESYINKNITFIIGFISEYISFNALSDEEQNLISEIKGVLKELSMHYDNAKLLAEKDAKAKGLYEYLEICMECQEKFLYKDNGEAECRFCDAKYDSEDFARFYLYERGFDEYSAFTDGSEFPCYNCPECSKNSFVIIRGDNFARCFACEVEYAVNEILFCLSCDDPFIDTEGSSGKMCLSCWNYHMNKD